MRADLERSQTANELAYEELVTVIEASKGTLALLIAVCDDLKLRDSIIQQYEQDLKPEFQTYQLQLAKDEPSLRAVLGKWAEQQNRSASSTVLTVIGAENLLWFKLQEDDFERTEVEKFFGYLQWGREGLREFPYPIVLWVTQQILTNLSLKAPDFWSWRKGVFRFVSDAVTDLPLPFPGYEHFLPPSLPDVDSFLLPLEDLQELITATEQREGTEAPLLGTLYSRLAQVYQRRIEQGETNNLQKERDLAIENYQKAIVLQRKLAQESILVDTLSRLGDFYHSQGLFSEALSIFENALKIARKIKNKESEGASISNLGFAYSALGEYKKSVNLYRQALNIFKAINHSRFEATTLNNLGISYYQTGEYFKSIDCHQNALAIQRQIGDIEGTGGSLSNLGLAYSSLGDYSRAIDFYQKALNVLKQTSHLEFLAATLGNLGLAYASIGQSEQAINLYQEALKIQCRIGNRHGEIVSLKNLGNAYDALEHYPLALDFYEQALVIAREIGDRQGEASSLIGLGNIHDSLSLYPQAIEFYKQSLTIVSEIGDRRGEANSWFNLGNTLTEMRYMPDALEAYRQARQIYAEIGLDAEGQDCDNAIQQLSASNR
jgi:tetratricopeptide (TPR) repeat protein